MKIWGDIPKVTGIYGNAGKLKSCQERILWHPGRMNSLCQDLPRIFLLS